VILSPLKFDGPRAGEPPPAPRPEGDGSFAAELLAGLQAAMAAMPPPLPPPAPVQPAPEGDWLAAPALAPVAAGTAEGGETEPAAVMETDEGGLYRLTGDGLETAETTDAAAADAGAIAVQISITAAPLADPAGEGAADPPPPDPALADAPPADPPPDEPPQAIVGDRIELTLDPEELGPLHLTLEPDGDRIRVHVTAEAAETVALAQASAAELTRFLVAAGYRETRLSFARAEPLAGPRALAPDGGARDGAPVPEAAALPDPPRLLHRRGLDLRV